MTSVDNARQRRLLVVSFHFPPDGAVGGMRWAGLTKYLARQGWECRVVTAATGAAGVEPGVTVLRVPRRVTINDRYAAMRARQAHAGSGPARPTAEPHVVTRRLSVTAYVRRELAFALSVPDEGRGWVFRGAVETRRQVREFRPHVVVSSGPPHSAHVAAWLGTRFTRVPWIVDLRDPWAGPIADAWLEYPRFQSTVFMNTNRLLERMVLRSATRVVCNTREFAAALGGRYVGREPRWIPNAVDRETLPQRDGAIFEGMALAYVGTIYGGRDLTPVLRGFRRFLDLVPGAGAQSKLRVAGNIEGEHLEDLQRTAARLRLSDRVEVRGQLPRNEALSIVTRSRAAIVLAQQQDFQVPAKLYEMVGLGTPTIVVTEEHSAAASEARRLGAYVVSPDDDERMTESLISIWNEGRRAEPLDSRHGDYESLAPEMSELLADSAGLSRNGSVGKGL